MPFLRHFLCVIVCLFDRHTAAPTEQSLGMLRQAKRRHLTVIYNPVSGQGLGKTVVVKTVVPILTMAKVAHKVIPTEYQGHCRELVQGLDITKTDGVVICGGDGLVSEAITGLMNRADGAHSTFPMGIVPVGTANAMAHDLDKGSSTTQAGLQSQAALAAAGGQTTKIDVIAVTGGPATLYGLSCFGWGLAGAVALKAAQLRWVPGQRKARYDIAGAITLMADWPVACPCTFEYMEEKPDRVDPAVMRKVRKALSIGVVNLIASNVSKLGKDHPISPGQSCVRFLRPAEQPPMQGKNTLCFGRKIVFFVYFIQLPTDVQRDDGHLTVGIIDDSASRSTTVAAGLHMRQGKYLTHHKAVIAFRTREFKILPKPDCKTPYNLDGDPQTPTDVHVTCLQQALNVFYIP